MRRALGLMLFASALMASIPLPATAKAKKKQHRTEAAADTTPPTITHVRLTRANAGLPIAIRAKIDDESEIFSPAVFVRAAGKSEFESIGMRHVGDAWEATIPAELVTGDLEYFIEAFDDQGNGPSREGSPEKPIPIQVVGGAAGAVVAPAAGSGTGAAPLPGATDSSTALAPKDDRLTAQKPEKSDDNGVTTKWWFWTLIGVAVTGAIVGTAIGVNALQSHGNVDSVDVTISGPSPTRGL